PAAAGRIALVRGAGSGESRDRKREVKADGLAPGPLGARSFRPYRGPEVRATGQAGKPAPLMRAGRPHSQAEKCTCSQSRQKLSGRRALTGRHGFDFIELQAAHPFSIKPNSRINSMLIICMNPVAVPLL